MKIKKRHFSLLKKYLWWYRGDVKDIFDKVKTNKIITYVLNFGDYEDLDKLLPIFSKDDIRKTLESPLHGVWDKRSLNFWTLYFGKD